MELQINIEFTDRAIASAPLLGRLQLHLSALPFQSAAPWFQIGDTVRLEGVPTDLQLHLAARSWTLMRDEVRLLLVLDVGQG